MLKVIIAGSRHFTNYNFVKQHCDFYLKDQQDVEIISGNAKGVDTLGEKYSLEVLSKEATKFPADWKKHGLAAGFIRNKEMAIYADALIAFWDGMSKGTGNMIKLAKKYNLKIRIVDINGNN